MHHDWLRPLCCGVAGEVPTSVPFDFHVSRQRTSLLPNFWSLMQDRSVGGALQAISRVIAISHPLLCLSHSCQSPTNIPTSEFLVSDAMAVGGRGSAGYLPWHYKLSPPVCLLHSCQLPTEIHTSEFLVSDATPVGGRRSAGDLPCRCHLSPPLCSFTLTSVANEHPTSEFLVSDAWPVGGRK